MCFPLKSRTGKIPPFTLQDNVKMIKFFCVVFQRALCGCLDDILWHFGVFEENIGLVKKLEMIQLSFYNGMQWTTKI